MTGERAMVEASIFDVDGTFTAVLVDETFVDAVDTVFCHASDETSVSDGYGIITLSEELFRSFVGGGVTSVHLPSDYGYFGAPVEVRSSQECSENDVVVELTIDDQVVHTDWELVPTCEEALRRFYDRLEDGMDAGQAWVEATAA